MENFSHRVSVFTICFLMPFAVFAASAKQAITLTNDGVSPNGTIEKQYKGSSDITIVYLKDAHNNYESQINSVKIMSYLTAEHNFKMIFNEGSASQLETAGLSSFPVKNSLKDVSLHFLKNGSINGVEYYSLLNPDTVTVEGIEDRTLYRSNYAAFYKSLSFRKKGAEYNTVLSDILDRLKPHYYSEDLLLLDEQAAAYHTGNITVFDFFDILLSYAQEFSFSFSELQNIALLDKALSHQLALNPTLVEQEKNALTNKLLQLANPYEKEDITRTLLQFEFHTISPDELNEYIAQKCDEYLVELDDFPLFAQYLAYSRILKQIDQESLITELEFLLEKVKTQLYPSPAAALIDRSYGVTQLIDRACTLTLTPNQTEQLTKDIALLDTHELNTFLQTAKQLHNISANISLEELKYMTFAIDYVNEFYALAHQRNITLVNNALRLLKEYDQKQAVLYIGGFHTNEICALLEQHDISYAVIKPKTSLFPANTPYTYLLSTVENNFLKSIETNIRTAANRNTLALASRLVPPSESLTGDTYSIEAFRQQLQALYVTGGIRTAIEPLQADILPFVASLREDRLAELSQQIAEIITWRNTHFEALENFSLNRNENNGLDLEFTIHGETYIAPYLISDEQRKSAFRANRTSADPLVTINFSGYPVTISRKNDSSLANQFSFAGFSDENIADFIQPLTQQPTIAETTLLQQSSLPEDDGKRLLSLLKGKGIIRQQRGKQLSLEQTRLPYYTTASTLFQSRNNGWVAVSDLDPQSFPSNFRSFLEQNNINRIELPDTITFSALLFMLETFTKVTTATTLFPKNAETNFLFEKHRLLGAEEMRLVISEQNTSQREVVFRERKYLLGPHYNAIIEKQLFGSPASKSSYLVLPALPPTQEIQMLDTQGTLRTVRLVKPEIGEKLWREINDITIDYDPLSDDFKSSGGLLFGYEAGAEYIITNFVPLDTMDYTTQTETSFTVDEERMEQLLSEYAVDGIKLLGQYHTHSPERLARGVTPGITRNDIMKGYPYNTSSDAIAATPLGIAFELSPADQETGGQPLSSLNPDSVKMFFYTQSPNLELAAYSVPALDFVTPGESAYVNADLRFISLNTEQVAQSEDPQNLATFRRLDNNRGFLLTTNGKLPQPQMQQLIQFFHSIRSDLDEYSDVKEIAVVRGPHIAHTNKSDSVLEFNEALLNYPRVLHYLALPHEWNHFTLQLDEAPEEVVTVMLDLHRFAEFYLTDKQEAELFLEELKEFEQPFDGRRLFHSILSIIKQRVLTSKKLLSPEEILVIAKQYIRSMPDLHQKTEAALSRDAQFFIGHFTNIASTAINLPTPLLPGSEDLVVFDETQLTQPEDVFRTSLGDQQTIALRYITLEDDTPAPLRLVEADETSSEDTDQQEKEPQDEEKSEEETQQPDEAEIRELSASIPYDTNFADSLGAFEPDTPSIMVNVSSKLHEDADGNLDPNMILATIIRQRTHLLLHHNQEILNDFVEIMNDEPHIKDSVLKLFLTLRKDRPFDQPLSSKDMEQLAQDPVYSQNGEIDYSKILNALISTANGFNAIKNTYVKLVNTKQRLTQDQQEIPPYLDARIAQLKNFIAAKQYQSVFHFSQEAEEFLRKSDRGLAQIFQISAQTTLHIMDITDEQIAQADNAGAQGNVFHVDFNRGRNPVTEGTDVLADVDTQSDTLSEDLLSVETVQSPAELAFSVPANKANEFLSLMSIIFDEKLPGAPQYTREFAYENAREFYEFLIKKHRESPQTALPVTIPIVDIFLGTPEYTKDFLDHFKELDAANNLFYDRLRYHIVGHSAPSVLMVQNLEQSGILADHAPVIQFDYYDNLQAKELRSATEQALLVRTFGNTALLNDALIVDKSNGAYTQTQFTPNLDALSLDAETRAAIESLMLDPSQLSQFQNIAQLKAVFSGLTWNESSAQIDDISTVPYGNFMHSYTERTHTQQGRFIMHPSLLELARVSLSGMNAQYGGYWQIFGNELTALHPALGQTTEPMDELDSSALETMMSPLDHSLFNASGNFIHEAPEQYLLHRISNQPFVFIADVVLSQLRNAADDLVELSKSVLPPHDIEDLSNLQAISELRQQTQFKTSNPETFQAFLKTVTTRGLLPLNFPIAYQQHPAGGDNFMYSIQQALNQQSVQLNESIIASLSEIAQTALTAPIVSEEDFFRRFETQVGAMSALFSQDYVSRVIDTLHDLYKNKSSVHLRAEITPSVITPEATAEQPDDAQSVDTQPREPRRVRIRKLSNARFQEYLAQVRKDLQLEYPELDFDNPRALANPIKNEIVYNGEHPEHRDADGDINIAELLQTVYHEKAHMLIFSRWDVLGQIVDNLDGREQEKDRILELFFKFKGAGQFIRTKNDLSRSPIWSRNGKIDYSRVLSELLAIINQYQSIPLIIDHLGKTDKKYRAKNKVTPPVVLKAMQHIFTALDQKVYMTDTVNARRYLTTLDPLFDRLLFSSRDLRGTLKITGLLPRTAPLPSTPIKTVFSDEELEQAITAQWDALPERKNSARLTGLQTTTFQTAAESIEKFSTSTTQTPNPFTEIASYWQQNIADGKVYILPSIAGNYSIKGTHFIHETSSGDIVFAEGYFTYLRDNNLLPLALANFAAKKTGFSRETIDSALEAPSIDDINHDIYEQYIRNTSYLPIIKDILSIYGIDINTVSLTALNTILNRYTEIMSDAASPELARHVQAIGEILSYTQFTFSSPEITGAFEIYAEQELNSTEINELHTAVLEIGAILQRQLKPPVIFLIDKNTLTGSTNAHNMELRQTLNHIRSEIETLEQRDVVLVAVDLSGTNHSAVSDELNKRLLYKGASADDFDYVVSYDTPDDLLAALQQEFNSFSSDELKQSIKIFAEANNPLIAMAQQNELQFQSINESETPIQEERGEGVFLVDYLRSLGLSRFFTEDSESPWAADLKKSMHILSIQPVIDQTLLAEQQHSVDIAAFAQHIEQSATFQGFNTILPEFLHQMDAEGKGAVPEIITHDPRYPAFEAQYALSITKKMFEELQKQSNESIDTLLALYTKLELAHNLEAQTTTPSYAQVVETFFSSLSASEAAFLNTETSVLREIAVKQKTTLTAADLPNLFLGFLIKPNQLSSSDLFILEKKMHNRNIQPVSLFSVLQGLRARGIEFDPALSRYLNVEIAPRKIEKNINSLIATQRLFEESA